jgi:hypothetical protein
MKKSKSYKVKIRGREYSCVITRHDDGEYSWDAYRDWKGWAGQRIGCFTRNECSTFPKTVARECVRIMEECRSKLILEGDK